MWRRSRRPVGRSTREPICTRSAACCSRCWRVAGRSPHTTPPRVDSLHPEVPLALGDLVAGLMAKDPDDRPDSAEEVRRALESVPADPVATAAATLPVTATAVLPRRAQAERRRKPWWPLVAGIVGVVVLLAVTTAAILARDDPTAAASSSTQPPSTAP